MGVNYDDKGVSRRNALKDDLRLIWRDGFHAFRNRSSWQMSPCNGCPLVDLCNAGCPARAFRAYGRVNNPDPNCPLVRQIMGIHIKWLND
ncbi:MAG: SPASM domain-containing protein [Vulcanisaeta sp. AZ3]|jgi:radical SAM protein with 4Fe4S-binding SPASM domain|nr:MAG: hypothetical protein TU36_06565 [Vulcanisaeta sp. AZ3]